MFLFGNICNYIRKKDYTFDIIIRNAQQKGYVSKIKNIQNKTNEEIVKLKKLIEESKTTLSFWQSTTPQEQFNTDLENV